jgi:hypothetical protein
MLGSAVPTIVVSSAVSAVPNISPNVTSIFACLVMLAVPCGGEIVFIRVYICQTHFTGGLFLRYRPLML